MLRRIILSFIILTAVASAAMADIIPPNSKYVGRCVTIENLDEFPDLVFIGIGRLGDSIRHRSVIKPGRCLNKGYKLNQFKVYATPRPHFEKVGLENLDPDHDPLVLASEADIDPEGGYMPKGSPLKHESAVYRVLGFAGNRLMIYKTSENSEYSGFWRKDKVETFPAPKIDGLRRTLVQTP